MGEVQVSSQAEKMLPIKIPRILKDRDDEKENDTSTKYSRIVINLPGVEGTTVTTRRNTFHPSEAFLTPLKPSERPAVTSPRALKTVEFPRRSPLSANRSPLLRLQKMREQAQKNLKTHDLFKNPPQDTDSRLVLPLKSQVRSSLLSHGTKTNVREVSSSLENFIIQSSPSKLVENSDQPSKTVDQANGSSVNPYQIEDGGSQQPTHSLHVGTFSKSYVEDIQQQHYDKIEELENILVLKTREIKGLYDKTNSLENNLADLQQDFVLQENRLNMLKDKEGLIEEELKTKASEIAALKHEIHLLRGQNDDLQSEKVLLQLSLQREKSETTGLFQELEQTKEERTTWERKYKAISDSFATAESTIETLQTDNNNLSERLGKSEESVHSLQRDLDAAKTDLRERKDEISQLEAIIDERNKTQQSSNEKLQLLMKEAAGIHEEMALFEKEYKLVESKLESKSTTIATLEEQISALNTRVIELENLRVTMGQEVSILRDRNEHFSEERENLSREIEDLRTQNADKDEIIRGDTKKLGELVLEIDTLKKLLASKSRQEESGSERNPDYDTQQLINSLQQQIAHAQEKTEERIQEVAEQLYHQYSKKHEVKVGQLKRKYETKLEENRVESEAQKRKIENLERLLLAETKDKNHLLSILEGKDLQRLK